MRAVALEIEFVRGSVCDEFEIGKQRKKREGRTCVRKLRCDASLCRLGHCDAAICVMHDARSDSVDECAVSRS